MQSPLLETLANALIFLFWFRVWSRFDRQLVFNRFLAPLGRATDSVFALVRPVFGRAPTRLVAAALAALLLCARSLLTVPDADVAIGFGFVGGHAQAGSLARCLLLSLFSFAKFLFGLWSFSLFYARRRSGAADQATQTVAVLSRPFSLLPLPWRPPVLLLTGMALALAASLLAGVAAPHAIPQALNRLHPERPLRPDPAGTVPPPGWRPATPRRRT